MEGENCGSAVGGGGGGWAVVMARATPGIPASILYISFYYGPKPEKIMVTHIYMNYRHLT